jgi:haloalkane dehalogenase
MRGFAKSMFSFSWAVSLFGIQQTLNLLSPSKATKAFDNVAEAAEGEFDGWLKTVFRTGDELQRELVDLTFGLLPEQVFREESQTVGPQGAAEPDISPNYPYKPHYLDVFGSKMHYIDEGAGETILFLHGNPTWSYLWRNIIPHLTPYARCIAPDLIGYGRSEKPDIEYRWFDHAKYLEGFIERMGLKNITLALHNQGSGLGFHYAMHHENNVRGIAFFEAIVRPFPWDEFSTPEFREMFRLFRAGGVGSEGWKMIVEQNFFIEQLLPQAAGRPLSETEMNFYREPFRDPKSRIPIWRFTRETPIGGEPKDVWEAVSEYSSKLQRSKLPKLMLYASPGALLTRENVEWCKRNISNLESVFLGPGSHFLQESSPHRIGREIVRWYSSLPLSRRM